VAPYRRGGPRPVGRRNLVFWQLFIAADLLWVGYVTTSLHWIFAVLQLCAASQSGAEEAYTV